MTKFKNIDMENMLVALEPLLDRSDMVGYAAARNTRLLKTCATEYLTRREELLQKYGEAEVVDGKTTGRVTLRFDSPKFKTFESEIKPYAELEHEVDIFTIPIDEAIGKLTGRQILNLDWMLEDEHPLEDLVVEKTVEIPTDQAIKDQQKQKEV